MVPERVMVEQRLDGNFLSHRRMQGSMCLQFWAPGGPWDFLLCCCRFEDYTDAFLPGNAAQRLTDT